MKTHKKGIVDKNKHFNKKKRRKNGIMEDEKGDWMINEKTFYDLSLLSYFDSYGTGITVSDMITYITEDKAMHREYNSQLDVMCNIHLVSQLDASAYQTFYVKSCFNDNAKSGVVYYVFECEEAYIIAFRGSEAYDAIRHRTGWQDWMDNFRMFLKNPTHQQILALQGIQSITMDKPFYLCGHSKGGNLALFCALTMRDELEAMLLGVCSFNAPGLTQTILTTYKQRAENVSFLKKIMLFENENDTVSSFFEHLKLPLYIKSSYPCTNLVQLYHNHNLYAMDFNDNLYLCADKKSVMPRMVYHFVNDFFINVKQERLERMVHYMDDYFMSELSIDELYKVLLYHISKYTSLFEEIAYDEVQTITIHDLIERRKTKYIAARLKELQPKDAITKMANELISGHSTKLNEKDVHEITQDLVDMYEALIAGVQKKVAESNKKMIASIRAIRKRSNEKEDV